MPDPRGAAVFDAFEPVLHQALNAPGEIGYLVAKEENGLDSFALAQRARCRGQEQRGLCGVDRAPFRIEREKVPLRFVLPGARQQEIASEDIAHNEGVQMRERSGGKLDWQHKPVVAVHSSELN